MQLPAPADVAMVTPPTPSSRAMVNAVNVLLVLIVWSFHGVLE
jgi:hypothetical protein